MSSLAMRAFEEFLSAAPDTPPLGRGLNGHYSMAFVSGSGGAHGTLAVMVEPGAAAARAFLLKIARELTSTHLEQEARALKALRESVSPALRPTLPEPCHVGSVDHHMYSIATLLPGRNWDSLLPGYSRLLRPRLVLNAVEWAGQLALDTMRDDGDHPGEEMIELLSDASRTMQSKKMQTRVNAARDLLREVHRDLPRVTQHGDFWPGNILLSGGRSISGVVDWESCLVRGLPGCDCMKVIRTAGVGEALAASLLRRYCEILDHPAVTPNVCRSLGIWDVFRTRRIVEKQCLGRAVMNPGRSAEAMLKEMYWAEDGEDFGSGAPTSPTREASASSHSETCVRR